MSFPFHHPFRSEAARARFLERYREAAERLPVRCDERFVDTSLGQTFVRSAGPEGAPPLVLLHGVSGSSLMWGANLPDLAEHFRVHAVDGIHDCGRSVYSRLAKDGDELADWLGEVLDGLEIPRGVRLAGLSYGGWIAALFARRHPERLAALVLLAPAMTVLPISAVWIARAVACALPGRFFTDSFMRWLLADTAAQGEAGARIVAEWAETSRLSMQCFARKPLLSPTLLTDEELAGLEVPTLFLVGENEKLYPAAQALARLERVAPRIERALIPGAGHDLTLAQTALVDGKIVEFLRRVGG